MIDWQGMRFKALDKDGSALDCEVLHAFDCAETGKSYVVYTDGAENAQGEVRFFASAYIETEQGLELAPVETQREWDIIEREVLTGR